jgi:AGCS family alanine or glycine:cation symporter
MDVSFAAYLTDKINDFYAIIYNPFAIPLVLLVVGGWLTVRTGVIQIRRFGTACKFVMKGAFKKDIKGEGTITPFQALSTALAATVGNGNIGGVATAILVGGPGAIFWMWLCAAVGMATKYAEAVLGVRYRVTTETGEMASGPMYYITQGLPWPRVGKVLAYMFCLFGAATAMLGTGNMAQSNTIARTFVEAAKTNFNLDVPLWVPGVLITTLCALVLIGGIRRIAAVTEKLVPTMVVVYLTAGLVYVFFNYAKIPGVFWLIIDNAFTPAAAAGGFIGAGVRQAIAAGISRGVLSNEAGLGSAPIAHGIAKVNHPVEQGVVGIFEVFVDTIVVCSMTAFVILSSGLWTDAAYQGASGDLTAAALGTSVPFAALIVALSSFLFGFSTLIGWCYYGEKCFEFMFGAKMIVPYRVVFTILIMLGSVVSVPLVWALGTLLNGFMAFPNLIGLLFLAGVVRQLTKEYFDRPRAEA